MPRPVVADRLLHQDLKCTSLADACLMSGSGDRRAVLRRSTERRLELGWAEECVCACGLFVLPVHERQQLLPADTRAPVAGSDDRSCGFRRVVKESDSAEGIKGPAPLKNTSRTNA